jgi:two-component system, NarL family, sensor kinase
VIHLIVPAALIGLLLLIHFVMGISPRKKPGPDFQAAPTAEQTLDHISAEIHDNISLTLAVSKIFLTDLDYTNSIEVEQKVNQSLTLLKRAIRDLNNLSKSLETDSTENFQLPDAVEKLTDEVRKAGLFDISYNLEGNYYPLAHGNELILFRIIQETLNNALRHSLASHVSVTLEYDTSKLIVIIGDNGIGFDQDKLNRHHGSGLLNMDKRAQMLNAKLILNSKNGAGTKIHLAVPLPNHTRNNANRKQHNQNWPC